MRKQTGNGSVAMKMMFGAACVAGLMLNLTAALAFGFSHSLPVHDMLSCILTPLEWLGRNLGFWPRNDTLGFYGAATGLWGTMFTGGWILSRRQTSPFWSLLLLPAVVAASVLFTFIFGWSFGRPA